jgi:predicted PurR-regulated permease PerM
MIAAVIALIGRPLVKQLERIHIGKFRFPNWANVVITLLLFLSVGIGLLRLLVPLIGSEIERLQAVDIQSLIDGSEATMSEIKSRLDTWGIRYDEALSTDQLYSYVQELFSTVSFSSIANSLLSTFGNLFVAAFSVLFISFFLLKERQILHNIIFTLTPDSQAEKVENVVNNTKRLLSRYFVGLLIQVTLITTLVSVGLLIVGVENAIILGCIAGLFNLVPYIGPFAGALFGILFTFTLNLDMDLTTVVVPLLLKMALVYAIVQLLDNLVFQPLIFSNSVFAHPLEIFLVISIAGTLLGVVGMILAIPLYTFVRIIAKEFLSEFKVVQTLTRSI